MMTVGVWNSLVSVIDLGLDDNGYLRAIPSPVSIAKLHIETSIDLSTPSVQGMGLTPTWVLIGNFSGPTTLIQTPIAMPRAGTWESFTVLTRTVASTSSVAIDLNKNGTSIFDTVGRPSFLPAATMASTASIKTKTFNKGDKFTVDVDLPAAGEDGHVTDITIIGNAI